MGKGFRDDSRNSGPGALERQSCQPLLGEAVRVQVFMYMGGTLTLKCLLDLKYEVLSRQFKGGVWQGDKNKFGDLEHTNART